MSENNNSKFASRLGFILVSVGCAVGLGNVWKFPYICAKNGGAAFIVIYLVCLMALGLPIIICEFTIGRGSGKSVGSAMEVLAPGKARWNNYRWIAFAGNYLLMMFYTMVAGWMLYYVYVMGSGKLSGKDTQGISDKFDNMLSSPGLMAFWTLVVVVLCVGVCALGVQNGVEKVTKIMMTLLMILMIIMAIHSVTLKNASQGLRYYLIPDFAKMTENGIGNVIFDAMTHAFFTLSVGIGSMEIFGSYISKERKLTGEAINILVLDTAIALVAGIIIIPACFAYGVSTDAGPSLLFITLPNVFNYMPGGRIWGMLFFVFMSFASLSTVIAVLENIVAISQDLFGWDRKKSVCVNLFGIAILSMPAVLGYNVWSGVQLLGENSTIMDVQDFIVSYNILPLGSMLIVLFCTKKNGWGFNSFIKEVDTGKGISFPKAIKGYMTYVLPAIVIIIYFKGYYDMFVGKSTVVFIAWMSVAVILAAFVFFLTLDIGKKKKDD